MPTPKTTRTPRATAKKKTAAQLSADIRAAEEEAALESALADAGRRTRAAVAEKYALGHVLREIGNVAGRGRVGDRKVFISSLYDQIGGEEWLDMTLEQFQRFLFRMHQEKKLVLARADLVAAMPHDLVMRSEFNTNGAQFHFVVDPGVGRG